MRLKTTRHRKYERVKTAVRRLAISIGVAMLSLTVLAPNTLAKAAGQPAEGGKFDPIQLIAVLPVVLFVAYLLFRPRKKSEVEEIKRIEGSPRKKQE